MKKATLRATASAFALLGAGIASTTMVAAEAAAQDYTSAALSGTVKDEGGNTVGGATVQLVSLDLGFTRTSTTGPNGTFRYSAVPPGNYDIVVSREGTELYRAEGLRLLASQNANVDVVIPGGLARDEEAIVVQGSTLLNDFEGTTVGLTVDVEELVKSVPLGRNLTSVVLLAPGTSSGDSSFGNLASIGGSSVAENAYYLNGLNLTNFDNYLGSAAVPFDMYRSVEVKSGGYPAEFGRATGGIVNAVTKSGSNDFFGAAHVSWEPDWGTESGKDIFLAGVPQTDQSLDERDLLVASIEAGGPVIRDRLFLYGLVQMNDFRSVVAAPAAGVVREFEQNDPFWGVKVDAYPIDSQHLEFTIFDGGTITENTEYQYTADGEQGSLTGGGNFARTGGVSFVGKWTGTMTDWLTLSAGYGRMKDRFDVVSKITRARFANSSGGTVAGVPFGGNFNDQTQTSTTFPWNTEREFYRGDADIYANLLGSHHFRLGFDVENNNLNKASVRTGGDFLVSNGYMSDVAYNANLGGAGIIYILRAGNQVELNYFNSAGSFDSKNKAFYIQDQWDVTDRLTLNLGLRRDDFSLSNAEGDIIADLDENYAPRLGFTYDLWPDQSGKLYGFYGQYYLPIASNTAFRATGNEFYTRERFEFLGVDGNGLPILGDQITDRADYQSPCPFPLTPMSSGQNCSVTGDGSVPLASELIGANLKATKETEWLVGYEHDFNGFQVGINYINRTLNTSAEDSAIDAAVLAYCDDQGIAGCSSVWTGFHQYTIQNPGSDLTVQLAGDFLCDTDPRACEVVTLSAEDLGYPKAVRKYDAVELTFNRPWNGVYQVGGSYTWSKSRGNTEGLVQSDFGQADAGITQDFDQPGFADFSYGRLPNDRKHRIKLFGAVSPFEGARIGTNILIQSPRPLSCFGFHPTDQFGNLYGAASHYCGLQPAPRGEGLETDWLTQVDLSGRYDINFGDDRVLTLRADVFNVFNGQASTQRYEFGDLDYDVDANGNTIDVIPDDRYGDITGYQTARRLRLGFDIAF